MSGCKHENIEVGVYEYCVDCGAVKRTYRPGQFVEEEWHSCPKCALAAPIADLVAGRRCTRGGEGGVMDPLHEHMRHGCCAEVNSLREENARLTKRLIVATDAMLVSEARGGEMRSIEEIRDTGAAWVTEAELAMLCAFAKRAETSEAEAKKYHDALVARQLDELDEARAKLARCVEALDRMAKDGCGLMALPGGSVCSKTSPDDDTDWCWSCRAIAALAAAKGGE